MVWYNPTTWENPLKGWWGAPAEEAELPPAEELAAPPAETEAQGEMPVGGRRRKHRKTKRSKKSKSKKTGRKH